MAEQETIVVLGEEFKLKENGEYVDVFDSKGVFVLSVPKTMSGPRTLDITERLRGNLHHQTDADRGRFARLKRNLLNEDEIF